MARANRHFIPGYIWHLTHRCHKREFLLKFSRDRDRWTRLLLEAKQRYGISVLNYVVTSNHIHLIALDNDTPTAIPKTMQFVAGRTAQEYNFRKQRKGAFWEDRYHATAIESGDHLWQCMVYVDMNMVRAGVVDKPSDWRWCGFDEIQNPKQRYRLIDHNELMRLLMVPSHEEFARAHRQWIELAMKAEKGRQSRFTQSLAVGSEEFVSTVSESLGVRAKGRRAAATAPDAFQLRESSPSYTTNDSDEGVAARGDPGFSFRYLNSADYA